MIDEIFTEFEMRSVTDIYRTKERIVERLIDFNITMLRSRVETIEEVFAKLNFYEYSEAFSDVDASLTMHGRLVCFNQDFFFKKGLFSVILTNRMLLELSEDYTTYVKAIASLPVPVDYQIPKMELNIRAATVKACKMVAERNRISVDAVDAWLFMHRKESSLKHHLCVTEFY